MEFTGEFFIPGKTEKRIEQDHLARYSFASKFVNGTRVLDIACGVGYGSEYLLRAGALSYTGVDINQASVDYANYTYGSYKAKFVLGDIVKYRDDPFDLITCFETIEHIKQYSEALKNLISLLRKDGILIISSPNRVVTSPGSVSIEDPPVNRFHSQEFTESELVNMLCENGFRISGVYGQRQRIWLKNKWYRKYLKKYIDPDNKLSPEVKKVRFLTPRYFVVVAAKK